MNFHCEHCRTLEFASGLCCLNGKVKLPSLTQPPESLNSSLHGETPESRHHKCNRCFQIFLGLILSESMALKRHSRFKARFTIESSLPLENTQHKFLQIYFMGNMKEQYNRRDEINAVTKKAILRNLQQLIHEHHVLVMKLKTALERMPRDDYKVVLRADKHPAGTH
ncbi:unnamed protein product [Pieris brassicae]|uniref:Uncharacterized protein n=1 Tax=Pieris brassicae TaxID=7116 RepID=A0A9P0TRA6_PIEBR|nr:unnamed protein product [Pieris brassicae]